jgi:aminoglycoside phosphotransferase (APT) family kinase protein
MQLDPTMQLWIENVMQGRVSDIKRLFGGGSRETFFLNIERENGVAQDIVFRMETGAGAFSGTEISLRREAVAYSALQGSGVRVPEIYAVSADGNALLMEKLQGEAAWHRIPAAERRAVAMDFVDQLATLHALDPCELPLPGFSLPRMPEEHALIDLQRWQNLYAQHTSNDDPLMHFAFAWLHAHAPAQVVRTVFVQGDTGVGNFLARNGRVTGFVDWEFSYVGDPHNDIAFVLMRNRNTQASADFAGWETEYERLSGIRIDPKTLLYYQIFVELRCVVTTAMSIHQGGGALGLAGYLMTRQDFRRHMADWLAQALESGVDTPVVPMPRPDASTPMFDRALRDLQTLVRPELREPSAKVGANAVRILLEHLRLKDQIGIELAEQERQDRRATFGIDASDQQIIDTVQAAGARAMLACCTICCAAYSVNICCGISDCSENEFIIPTASPG